MCLYICAYRAAPACGVYDWLVSGVGEIGGKLIKAGVSNIWLTCYEYLIVIRVTRQCLRDNKVD